MEARPSPPLWPLATAWTPPPPTLWGLVFLVGFCLFVLHFARFGQWSPAGQPHGSHALAQGGFGGSCGVRNHF